MPPPAARARLYGLRSRLTRIRREGRTDPSLLRWYPAWQLVDPYAVIDLTSPWEQAWTTRWVAQSYADEGSIVELGTWLGATSRAIARGLARRDAAPTWGIHVYDTFAFDDIEARTEGLPLGGRHRDGDGFEDLYRGRAGRLPGLQVHRGDVLDANWSGPIEFLFVDVAKTWEIWRHVRATFVAHLIPGATLVQQDWAHAYTPWLHLWHHRWRAHFEVVGHVPHSSSVVFRLLEALPPEAIAADELADHPPSEVEAAFAWAAGLVRAPERPHIAGARVMLHALHGDLDDGIQALLAEAVAGPVTGELAEAAIPELARRVLAPPAAPASGRSRHDAGAGDASEGPAEGDDRRAGEHDAHQADADAGGVGHGADDGG